MNIIFDLDGTLIDPREGILACLKYMLNSIGHRIPSDSVLERCIGPPLQENVVSLVGPSDPEIVTSAIGFYRQRFSLQGMYECKVYQGIFESLTELQNNGAMLFVATSKPKVYSDRIIEHFRFNTFFQKVYGSELDGTRANKVELISHLMKEEGIACAETFMIGDRSHDIEGALVNHITPIGALWGYGSRAELATAGATIFCESPRDIIRVIA